MVLIFGLLTVFVLVTPSGEDFLGRMLRLVHESAQPSAPVKPLVLMVTSSREDQVTASEAVKPRGYRVLTAETASVAGALLQADNEEIGVIVVDMRMAHVGKLVDLAHRVAPSAKVIPLRPDHTTTDLSALLIAVI